MALNVGTEQGINNPVFPLGRKLATVFVVKYGRISRRFWTEAEAEAFAAEKRQDPANDYYSVKVRRSVEVLTAWAFMTPEMRKDKLVEDCEKAEASRVAHSNEVARIDAIRDRIVEALRAEPLPNGCSLITCYESGWRFSHEIQLRVDYGEANDYSLVEIDLPSRDWNGNLRPATVSIRRYSSSMTPDYAEALAGAMLSASRFAAGINAMEEDWPKYWPY
jgi:hypothetical protein